MTVSPSTTSRSGGSSASARPSRRIVSAPSGRSTSASIEKATATSPSRRSSATAWRASRTLRRASSGQRGCRPPSGAVREQPAGVGGDRRRIRPGRSAGAARAPPPGCAPRRWRCRRRGSRSAPPPAPRAARRRPLGARARFDRQAGGAHVHGIDDSSAARASQSGADPELGRRRPSSLTFGGSLRGAGKVSPLGASHRTWSVPRVAARCPISMSSHRSPRRVPTTRR